MKKFKSNKKNIISNIYTKLHLTNSGVRFFRIDPGLVRKIKYRNCSIYCNSTVLEKYQEFIKNNKFNKIDYTNLAKDFGRKKKWNVCNIYSLVLENSPEQYYDEFYIYKRLNYRKRKKIIKQLLRNNLKKFHIIKNLAIKNTYFNPVSFVYDYGQFFYF